MKHETTEQPAIGDLINLDFGLRRLQLHTIKSLNQRNLLASRDKMKCCNLLISSSVSFFYPSFLVALTTSPHPVSLLGRSVKSPCGSAMAILILYEVWYFLVAHIGQTAYSMSIRYALHCPTLTMC